mmetsp:Transcript_114957/g.326099  ORF Transcript_114957/g.326099 Transcript_114957/m.326099 type:complete len:313 (-) Transcript_114957:853-1791(-)
MAAVDRVRAGQARRSDCTSRAPHACSRQRRGRTACSAHPAAPPGGGRGGGRKRRKRAGVARGASGPVAGGTAHSSRRILAKPGWSSTTLKWSTSPSLRDPRPISCRYPMGVFMPVVINMVLSAGTSRPNVPIPTTTKISSASPPKRLMMPPLLAGSVRVVTASARRPRCLHNVTRSTASWIRATFTRVLPHVSAPLSYTSTTSARSSGSSAGGTRSSGSPSWWSRMSNTSSGRSGLSRSRLRTAHSRGQARTPLLASCTSEAECMIGCSGAGCGLGVALRPRTRTPWNRAHFRSTMPVLARPAQWLSSTTRS